MTVAPLWKLLPLMVSDCALDEAVIVLGETPLMTGAGGALAVTVKVKALELTLFGLTTVTVQLPAVLLLLKALSTTWLALTKVVT